ncbi:MFS transporter [Kitasatospora viridis]|uniref:MFS transporter n=1 Tax=Kitasatospora viridis TaxID=281105 RepID=A0A561SES4_9ACTN|nr:MFS transporter [Kitasatospora viridis]TWF73350.1 MFS transporter [Kitasatospora viridis]
MSARSALHGVVRLAGPRLPVVSFLARLPAALCPTGTLLMVTAFGGVARGGIVAGVLWAGQAVGGPVLGRSADRLGHRPVILAASVANALMTTALVLATLARWPLAVQAGCALLAGLTVPQIGPLSRTRWIDLASRHRDGRELVGSALSFDAVVDEASFVVGPALVGILAWAVHPAAGLVCAAVLMAVFGTVFALHPSAPGAAPRAVRTGRLLSRPLLVLLAVAALQGMVFGATNTGVQDLARGDAGVGGLVWSAMGATSAAAGVLLAAFSERFDLTVRLRVALAAQALLALTLLLVEGAVGATLAVAAIGLAVAPALIALFGLVERIAPVDRMGEAMTFLGSGMIAGQGLAVVAAGRLAGGHGYSAAFSMTCAAGGLAVLLALMLVRRPRYPAGHQSAPQPVVTASSV